MRNREGIADCFRATSIAMVAPKECPVMSIGLRELRERKEVR